VRAFIKHNSLSLFFLGLFLAAVVFQAIAGHAAFNEEQDRHGDPRITLLRYVTSSEYGAAVMENWQSEYLQFTLLILLTVWLLQRGSPESKELHKAGRESDEDQLVGEHARKDSPLWAKVGGIRRTLYENSLLLVMGTIWAGTWFAQSVTGVTAYNAERLDHHEDPVSWADYLTRADFWEMTLQNWQSEFLAVGSMAIFAVYLRQRGSPESKPVGAPHHTTGVEG
jgi:membrane protein implicated in regulation of membrane protease activity